MTGAAPGTTSEAPSGRTGSLVGALAEDPNVTVAFTGRHGADGAPANLSLLVGEGDVRAARAEALGLVGIGLGDTVFMQQVHGAGVADVTAADAGRGADDHADAVPGVDALVTRATDVALAVLVADCVPVVLVDPGAAVGVVHAGREGVMQGVVSAAVETMTDDAAGRVVAMLGPAIGGCCYELPLRMVEAVSRRWPDAGATTTWGAPSVDLPAAVAAQLAAAGVGDVRRVGACTRCDHDRWFSHRAAGAGLAPEGRQAAIVVRSSRGAGAAPDTAATVASLQSP